MSTPGSFGATSDNGPLPFASDTGGGAGVVPAKTSTPL